MKKLLLIPVLLAAGFLPLRQRLEAQDSSPGRNDPIDVNLIIDGSRYMRDTADSAAAWICDYLLNNILQEGDYLRVWVAENQAVPLYQGVLEADNQEAVKDLVRKPLPESGSADFSGALAAAGTDSGRENSLMTYTLLVCSPWSLSPALQGNAASSLRYFRVLEFPGWRALVVALDIGQQVRDAAASFLRGG
ncbi:MAG: hypothetical protein LBH51_02960 [Treponema sp.]|jgi:hypothetical protein|nr:hypothetical protein [Treponema sp.]